jgi:hypothetical protein
VRGTASVFCHETWCGNLQPVAPGQEKESITCAVPLNAHVVRAHVPVIIVDVVAETLPDAIEHRRVHDQAAHVAWEVVRRSSALKLEGPEP